MKPIEKNIDKRPKSNKDNRIAANVVGLVCVFLFMAAAAIVHSGRLLGHSFEKPNEIEGIIYSGDTTIINTTSFGKDIIGYSGPTPLNIYVVNDRIVRIEPLDNSETPGFFRRVVKSGLFDSWNGKSLEEAADVHVDAVTGATFSSKAVIANVEAGIRTALSNKSVAHQSMASDTEGEFNTEFFIVLAVIIAAMSIPLFWKNKNYRRAQQLLNVVILGFWSGTFVDYTLMLNVMSNGLTLSASIIVILMLVAAFIYPLFGKDGYYCAWVCPLGSLQELASGLNTRHRLHLSVRTIKALTTFRMVLWGALMLCLWTGIWMSWIDYELFTAFIVENAAVGVLIAGGILIILSLFVPRPYCRFVCPTGTLLRMSQNIDTK